MAVFQYRGLDKSGRAVAGTMAAEDAINLEEKLRASGYWLLDAQAKEGTRTAKNGDGSWGAIACDRSLSRPFQGRPYRALQMGGAFFAD